LLVAVAVDRTIKAAVVAQVELFITAHTLSPLEQL
jgi:hypothetical protein